MGIYGGHKFIFRKPGVQGVARVGATRVERKREANGGAAAPARASLRAMTTGRFVGIDTSCLLHEFGSIFRKQAVTGDTSWYPRVVALVEDFAARFCMWGATPVFVFDNRVSPYKPKAHTDAKRRALRAAAAEKIASGTASDNDYGAAFSVTVALQDLVFTALQRTYTCIAAPFEADATLAVLFTEMHVDFILSSDSDFVVHGVGRQIIEWDVSSDSCVAQSFELLPDDDPLLRAILKCESRSSLLRIMAVACGCDYFKVNTLGEAFGRETIIAAAAALADGSLSISDGAIAAWLTAAIICKHAGKEVVLWHKIESGGVAVTHEALLLHVRAAIEAFKYAPAFSVSKGSVVTVCGYPPPADAAARLGFNWAALNSVDADGNGPAERAMRVKPLSAAASASAAGSAAARPVLSITIKNPGINGVEYPTRPYAPGYTYRDAIGIKTIEQSRAWLAATRDTTGITADPSAAALKEQIAYMVHGGRRSLLPEPPLASFSFTPRDGASDSPLTAMICAPTPPAHILARWDAKRPTVASDGGADINFVPLPPPPQPLVPAVHFASGSRGGIGSGIGGGGSTGAASAAATGGASSAGDSANRSNSGGGVSAAASASAAAASRPATGAGSAFSGAARPALSGSAAAVRSASVGGASRRSTVRTSEPAERFRFYNSDLDASAMQEILPVLPHSVIADLFNSREWHANSKPLRQASAVCQTMSDLPRLTLCLPRDQSGVQHMWVTYNAHSSIGKDKHNTVQLQLILRYSDLEPGDVDDAELVLLPEITSVRHAHCGCIAGLSAHCWHVAECLYAMYNFPRRNQSIETVTSRLCCWTQPPSQRGMFLAKLRTEQPVKVSMLTAVGGGGGGRIPAAPAASKRLNAHDEFVASLGGVAAFSPASSMPSRDDKRYEPTGEAVLRAAAASYGTVPSSFFWPGPGGSTLDELLELRDARYAHGLARANKGEEASRESLAALDAFRRDDAKNRGSRVEWLPARLRSEAALPAAAGAGLPQAPGAAAGAGGAADAAASAADAARQVAAKEAERIASKVDSGALRPFFETHPADEMLDPTTPIFNKRTGKKQFFCRFCGFRDSREHWLEGLCKVWEVEREGGVVPVQRWQDRQRKRISGEKRKSDVVSLPLHSDPLLRTFKKARQNDLNE